jgi:hypothetical protein
VTLWAAAACGFALSPNRWLGVMLATVPISAFALAAFRLVPLYERLSLWVVPALYAGIALFCDSALRLARDGLARRRWPLFAAAVVIAVVGFRVCSDVFNRGWEEVRAAIAARDNHQLDDRGGVQWLMRQHQPADVLIATHLALPAIWWYGDISISNQSSAGSRQGDGSPILEAGYNPPGPDCRRNQLFDALGDRRRALVYFGFRFDDVPKGFDGLLLDSLAEVGDIRAFRNFAEVGRAAVIERHGTRAGGQREHVQADIDAAATKRRPGGCVGVQPASRW